MPTLNCNYTQMQNAFIVVNLLDPPVQVVCLILLKYFLSPCNKIISDPALFSLFI